jgi:hypothetical protein
MEAKSLPGNRKELPTVSGEQFSWIPLGYSRKLLEVFIRADLKTPNARLGWTG